MVWRLIHLSTAVRISTLSALIISYMDSTCIKQKCKLCTCMRGSRYFARGGVQANLPENSSDNVYLFISFSPQLILQFYIGCPMVISKKTVIVQGFRGGPTFSRGGGGLISIETHITCDFPGGVRTPYPPSGSAHDLYSLSLCR